MSYKTYESDENGRLIICRALYPPRDRGIFGLLRKLIESVLPENARDGSGEKDKQK